MQARLGGSVSGRYRPAEKILLTKHVVAAGTFAKDAGSTPAASTIFPAGKNGAAPKRAFERRRALIQQVVPSCGWQAISPGNLER